MVIDGAKVGAGGGLAALRAGAQPISTSRRGLFHIGLGRKNAQTPGAELGFHLGITAALSDHIADPMLPRVA
jgi:hypothetical protein